MSTMFAPRLAHDFGLFESSTKTLVGEGWEGFSDVGFLIVFGIGGLLRFRTNVAPNC